MLALLLTVDVGVLSCSSGAGAVVVADVHADGDKSLLLFLLVVHRLMLTLLLMLTWIVECL